MTYALSRCSKTPTPPHNEIAPITHQLTCTDHSSHTFTLTLPTPSQAHTGTSSPAQTTHLTSRFPHPHRLTLVPAHLHRPLILHLHTHTPHTLTLVPAHLHRPLSFTTSQTIISVSCNFKRGNQFNHMERGGRGTCLPWILRPTVFLCGHTSDM